MGALKKLGVNNGEHYTGSIAFVLQNAANVLHCAGPIPSFSPPTLFLIPLPKALDPTETILMPVGRAQFRLVLLSLQNAGNSNAPFKVNIGGVPLGHVVSKVNDRTIDSLNPFAVCQGDPPGVVPAESALPGELVPLWLEPAVVSEGRLSGQGKQRARFAQPQKGSSQAGLPRLRPGSGSARPGGGQNGLETQSEVTR